MTESENNENPVIAKFVASVLIALVTGLGSGAYYSSTSSSSDAQLERRLTQIEMRLEQQTKTTEELKSTINELRLTVGNLSIKKGK